VSAREALQHRWFRTAPDKHNAEAQDNISRRFTRENSFATTATFFGPDSRPGSRRPSRAPTLADPDSTCSRFPTLPRPSLSARSDVTRINGSLRVTAEDDTRSVRSDVTRWCGVLNTDDLRSDTRTSSPQSVHTCFTPVTDVDPDENQKDHVEGKVFRITRGGLQQAAWGEEAEYRLANRLTHM